MRQITIDSIRAFSWNLKFKRQNMEVRFYDGGNTPESWFCRLLLHGNIIAEKDETGFYISSCGWLTNTTKERLNGFSDVHIQQQDFTWYLNGKIWNGQRIKV